MSAKGKRDKDNSELGVLGSARIFDLPWLRVSIASAVADIGHPAL
jgi:hypothetical protein